MWADFKLFLGPEIFYFGRDLTAARSVLQPWRRDGIYSHFLLLLHEYTLQYTHTYIRISIYIVYNIQTAWCQVVRGRAAPLDKCGKSSRHSTISVTRRGHRIALRAGSHACACLPVDA